MAALGSVVTLGACAERGVKGVEQGTAPGAGYNFGSLASEFLQSQTERRILDQKEAAAPACQEHRFLKASVVRQPAETDLGKGVTERKWVERWALDRCGTPAAYWVYFAEVGKGGAYIAVRDAKTSPAPGPLP
jgi:hypothetical protein